MDYEENLSAESNNFKNYPPKLEKISLSTERYNCKICIRSLRILLITTFISSFNFALIFPILFSILKEFQVGPILFGIIASIYSILQLTGIPIVGIMSDRFNRKTVLMITIIGSLFS